MSQELTFNAGFLDAAAAWVKKAPKAQSGSGQEAQAAADHDTTSKAPGGNKKRAGLGLVQKKEEKEVGAPVTLALSLCFSTVLWFAGVEQATKPIHGALQKLLEGTKKRARKEAEEKALQALHDKGDEDEDDDDLGEAESKVRAFKGAKPGGKAAGEKETSMQPPEADASKKKRKKKKKKGAAVKEDGGKEAAKAAAPPVVTAKPSGGSSSTETKPPAAQSTKKRDVPVNLRPDHARQAKKQKVRLVLPPSVCR